MNLSGKKLLMMGGGAYFEHIKKYAEETGFTMVAVGNNPQANYYLGANESYPYSTMDVDSIEKIINATKIDGIFVGAQELNMPPAMELAKRTEAKFYADQSQWDILSDKALFKKLCVECGVPVVPEYRIDTEDAIENLPYPILIKPVDGSGAHGMNVCYFQEDFRDLYEEALSWSQKKAVIVEELITNADETFFQYTIQEGKCSLTSAFTKVFTISDNKARILPIFHMYPSKHLDEYFNTVHESIKLLLKKMNIKNGVMTIQSFYKEGKFYIFEAGFRMGGAQNYILSEFQNGTNSLHYMINYALTGKMCDQDISKQDNAYFKYPCCNYYVGLNAGRIASMPNVDEVSKLPGVLNVTVMRKIGDVIEDTNALDRICLRLHVVGETPEKLAKNLVEICKSIKVVSSNGEDMLMERLTYERCFNAICDTVSVRN